MPLSLGTYLANAAHLNVGRPQPERRVVYGTVADGTTNNGTQLVLDVWRTGQPDSGPLRPAVVLVHGGAWVHSHRSGMPVRNRWLNALGYEATRALAG